MKPDTPVPSDLHVMQALFETSGSVELPSSRPSAGNRSY